MATPKLPAKAGKLNIVIEQGATFNSVLTWRDADGTAINITGYTARMQIRADIDDTATLHEFTSVAGDIILGGAAGTITFNISDTVTAAMSWTKGVYDLEVIDGAGTVRRLLQGSVTVSPEVTR